MTAPVLYFNMREGENVFWDACSVSQHGAASSITPEKRNLFFGTSQWHKLMEGVLGHSIIGFMFCTSLSPLS